jgi:hypothetical protein
MSARGVIPDSSGFSVCWSGGFPVVKLPARRGPPNAAAGHPGPGARRVARLVALDEAMPVHASVPGAVAAAVREATTAAGGGG